MQREKKRPVSFRLSERQIVFIDLLAAECGGCSRTAVMSRLLDLALLQYHKQVTQKTAQKQPDPDQEVIGCGRV